MLWLIIKLIFQRRDLSATEPDSSNSVLGHLFILPLVTLYLEDIFAL